MKSLFIIFGIGMLLLFTGCSDTSGQQNGFELNSFEGGDKALTFEFGENEPPENIRDQSTQTFSVRLVVKNEGEYSIPENSSYVRLRGFDAENLGLNKTSQTLFELRGVRKQGENNVIPGGQQQVVFSNLKYKGSVVSGSIPLNLFAQVCYPYSTTAFTILCIKGNTNSGLDDRAEICEISEQKKYSNSGGPIAIENVEQYPLGSSSIMFQFDIVHTPMSDNANVYERGSIDNMCNINGNDPTTSGAILKKDRVTYTVESGLEGLNCESTGGNTNTVTLASGSYTVTCVQDTTGEDTYERPVTITLDYDYMDRVEKMITIEHVDIS